MLSRVSSFFGDFVVELCECVVIVILVLYNIIDVIIKFFEFVNVVFVENFELRVRDGFRALFGEFFFIREVARV